MQLIKFNIYFEPVFGFGVITYLCLGVWSADVQNSGFLSGKSIVHDCFGFEKCCLMH